MLDFEVATPSCPPGSRKASYSGSQLGRDSVRILHVLGRMDLAGIETWLMQVMRRIDRTRFRMNFAVVGPEKGYFDEEVHALGGRVLPCTSTTKPWAYLRGLQRVLFETGPYDVIHAHFHHYNGLVMRAAHKVGLPHRIAHSHNDILRLEASAGWVRKIYLQVASRWIHRYTTVGLACSRTAATGMFGPGWMEDGRCRVHYSGIDLSRFRFPVDRRSARLEWGLSAEDFVVGHVGRFSLQKNHAFIIDVACEVRKRDPRVRFLLIGDGDSRRDMESQAKKRGMDHAVLFAGTRSDVPRLMRGVMDAFIFPSLWEGLGLALIEAQAAGLPCLISDVIPDEVDVVPGLVRRASLSQSASSWTKKVLSMKAKPPRVKQMDAMAALENSPFNIERGVGELEMLYMSIVSQERMLGAALD